MNSSVNGNKTKQLLNCGMSIPPGIERAKHVISQIVKKNPLMLFSKQVIAPTSNFFGFLLCLFAAQSMLLVKASERASEASERAKRVPTRMMSLSDAFSNTP